MKLEPGKILHRAEQRLGELSQVDGKETLRLLRSFLRMESHRLCMLHRYGLGGMEMARARSQVVDALIAHLYRLVMERYQTRQPATRRDRAEPAVVAVGGYGRGELSPHSDVDLLILYDRSSVHFGRFLAEELIYLLWDIGLKVGHSWRTPEQCLELARQDSTAENSLLDARWLTGGREVFAALLTLMDRHWTANPGKFVERKRAELEERYGKLGETVFLVEPNVKESPGGMRDFHAMLWLAQGCWRAGGGRGLVQEGIVSERDWQRAERGYDWLSRVRNELHYSTDRRADQLTLALQEDVAAGLRYRPQKHMLPPEALMHDYFQHADNLHHLLRLVLSAAQQQKGKLPRQVLWEFPGGLQLIRAAGELHLADTTQGRFPSSPLEMIRVFSVAQEQRLSLGEDVKKAVRNHLSMIRRDWQRNPEMSREFLQMLRRPGRVGAALRAMHSCRFLGKYLPEFAHITCLMQHDYYHRYTTDEHTLRAIELLDAIWLKPPPSLERYRDLIYHISDPAPLYLALLLHDAGKGLGGGHSDKGAQRAHAIATRLGMPEKKAAQVELLVRHHLVMAHLSQRRDLSDRRVTRQAAELLGDMETLSMLCLLTYADTAAVSPEVWTEWKNTLLWELYGKVHMEFLGLEAASAREREKLQEIRFRVQSLLQASPEAEADEAPLPPATAQKLMEEHFSLLPPRYPLDHRPELIARQILLVEQARATGPAVAFLPIPEEGNTLLLLCCPDTAGLFAKVTGTLAALEVNILGARLDTRQDNLAVDVLSISTSRGEAVLDPSRLRRIRGTVEGVLKGTLSFEDLVTRIDAGPLAPTHRPPQIVLNNEISEGCTVLEVLAEDRLGFAYSVAKCLTDLHLDIVFAKLSTEKAMAFDVFYLKDADGNKLSESRWDEVGSQLETALQITPQKEPLRS
ncbi:MAG: [protein-PII] uridylyltransferase [Acidobacteria bacterium]|nr:[protein-PII] uridylyltransferase [Acidobacteriota bacterium]